MNQKMKQLLKLCLLGSLLAAGGCIAVDHPHHRPHHRPHIRVMPVHHMHHWHGPHR